MEILENIENYKQYNKSHQESHHLEITRINVCRCRKRYRWIYLHAYPSKHLSVCTLQIHAYTDIQTTKLEKYAIFDFVSYLIFLSTFVDLILMWNSSFY